MAEILSSLKVGKPTHMYHTNEAYRANWVNVGSSHVHVHNMCVCLLHIRSTHMCASSVTEVADGANRGCLVTNMPLHCDPARQLSRTPTPRSSSREIGESDISSFWWRSHCCTWQSSSYFVISRMIIPKFCFSISCCNLVDAWLVVWWVGGYFFWIKWYHLPRLVFNQPMMVQLLYIHPIKIKLHWYTIV